MFEFDYVVVYRAIGAFVLASAFTLLSLGMGISKIGEILISSCEMKSHQAAWVAPLILLLLVLEAILANPVIAVSTVGVLSAIIGVTTLVRLWESY